MNLFRSARRRASVLAAIFALAAAAPAAAEPALWVIRDADSTIYLFGTVHVLRPGMEWRSPKIARALAESGDLVLEIEQPEDPAAIQPLIVKYGMDPARPLSSKLAPRDKARLDASAKAIGAPPQALDPMRPWLAAMTLAVAPLIKAGYDPKSGVENVLAAEVKAAGKPISALETMEQQVRFFADMEPNAELALLKATLDDVDGATAQLDAMVGSWASGDVAALEAAFVTEIRRDYPELYAPIIVRRNTAWADQLVAALKGSGVSFVAVGAGHLVGPDSVQAELAKRGVTAERL